MKKRTFFFLILMLSNCLYAIGSDTLTIAVSNQLNKGISLGKALKKVKEYRINGIKKTICLQLRNGTYTFEKTIHLEGSTFSNLIISAFPNEKVNFSGGINIPTSQIKRTNKGKKNLYKVNLNRTAVKEMGHMRSVGFLRPYGVSWPEPFINEKPLKLCRYPNKSTEPIGKVLDEGSLPYKMDHLNRGGIFTYKSDRISRWKTTDDMWISGYFRHGYADDMVPIKHINVKEKTIETKSATFWGYGSGAPWNRFFVLNVFEELDLPGEYMVNKKKNVLFFISNKKIKNLTISQLKEPFFELYKVKNIRIEGITFEYSRFLAIAMSETESCRINKCVFRNMGSSAISVGLGVKPFDCLVEDSVGTIQRGILGGIQTHIYAQSELNRKGGHKNGITNCEFYDLGSGAISLGGGNRITLTPGENYIEKCNFHNTNRIEKSYRPAVHITGVGNRLCNSEIYNLPAMAVLLHGNNHLVENNSIHHVCIEINDNGALYLGKDPSNCGNIVRKNTFANIGSSYSSCSVYIDDGAGGITVEDNIFYQAGHYGILLGGGSDNQILHNLFIDTPIAIHIDNRLQNWAKHLLGENGLFKKRLLAVNAFGEIYLKQYPFLSLYKRNNGLPARNLFFYNKYRNVDTVCDNPQWIQMKNNKKY